jgi:hypothetical protein
MPVDRHLQRPEHPEVHENYETSDPISHARAGKAAPASFLLVLIPVSCQARSVASGSSTVAC